MMGRHMAWARPHLQGTLMVTQSLVLRLLPMCHAYHFSSCRSATSTARQMRAIVLDHHSDPNEPVDASFFRTTMVYMCV